jgi:hypothetical protein
MGFQKASIFQLPENPLEVALSLLYTSSQLTYSGITHEGSTSCHYSLNARVRMD